MNKGILVGLLVLGGCELPPPVAEVGGASDITGWTSVSLTAVTGTGYAVGGEWRARRHGEMVTVNNDNNAQGLSATATFTWEAQNT